MGFTVAARYVRKTGLRIVAFPGEHPIMEVPPKYLIRPRVAAVATAMLAAIGWLLLGVGPTVAQDATPTGYKAYKLQHAVAADFAAQLRKVFGSGPGKAEVLVDARANRVLVQGNEET